MNNGSGFLLGLIVGCFLTVLILKQPHAQEPPSVLHRKDVSSADTTLNAQQLLAPELPRVHSGVSLDAEDDVTVSTTIADNDVGSHSAITRSQLSVDRTTTDTQHSPGTSERIDSSLEEPIIEELHPTSPHPKQLEDWPDTEVWVRTTLKKRVLYHALMEMFLKSVSMFWRGKVVVVLDNNPVDRVIGQRLVNTPPYPRVLLESYRFDMKQYFPGKFPKIRMFKRRQINVPRGRGYDAQEYSTFWLDSHSNATYIAIMDTDAMFLVPQIPALWFDERNGKPYAWGKRAEWGFSHCSIRDIKLGKGCGMYRNETKSILKLAQVCTFGDPYPLVIRRDDLSKIREYLKNVWQEPFHAVFRRIASSTTGYCQFCIMWNYLYRFQPDNYSWKISGYLNDLPPSDPYLPDKRRGGFWPALHSKLFSFPDMYCSLYTMMLAGLCISHPHPTTQRYCKDFPQGVLDYLSMQMLVQNGQRLKYVDQAKSCAQKHATLLQQFKWTPNHQVAQELFQNMTADCGSHAEWARRTPFMESMETQNSTVPQATTQLRNQQTCALF